MNILSISVQLSSLQQQISPKQELLLEINTKINELNDIQNDNIRFIRNFQRVMKNKYKEIINGLILYKESIEQEMKL